MLTKPERAFLNTTWRAVLATIRRDGRSRLVPICFVVDPERPVLYTPLDDKPKRDDDPLALARVRDIGADPRVTVLADRWDEDWSRLAWLRIDGRAALVAPDAPGHAGVVEALRAKYPPYRSHRLETRPVIAIIVEGTTGWGALSPDDVP